MQIDLSFKKCLSAQDNIILTKLNCVNKLKRNQRKAVSLTHKTIVHIA